LLFALRNHLIWRSFGSAGIDMKYLTNTNEFANMLQIAAGKIDIATDRGATRSGNNESPFYTE
jgi:hypothetical protein